MQVLVLRLQTTGSVEERILEASSHKRSLADRSITGMTLIPYMKAWAPCLCHDQPMSSLRSDGTLQHYTNNKGMHSCLSWLCTCIRPLP